MICSTRCGSACDQAEVDRFAAFLRDPDPDRAAAYQRHYPNAPDAYGRPTGPVRPLGKMSP